VVQGRPDHLFNQPIAKGRAQLEQLTTVGKVRYGDYPENGCDYLSAVTLVSGITDFSRLDQMKRRVEELNWAPNGSHQPAADGVPEPSPF